MAQITNDRAADRPRLRLIPGGQATDAHRKEQLIFFHYFVFSCVLTILIASLTSFLKGVFLAIL